MIIDAKNMIVGRIATVAAKNALLGEEVRIINCEHALVTGKKKYTLAEAKRKQDQGTFKGPFLPRMPDRYVRRIIRGMLPYKQEKGMKAFKRVMCYSGVPAEFEGKDKYEIPGASISKVGNLNYISVGRICERLGGKV